MNVYLATDHAGFEMKEEIKKLFISGAFGEGYTVIDCGAEEYKDGDKYPFYISRAVDFISKNAMHNPSIGVVFGGSGTGEAIVANRYPYVRAAIYQGADISLVALAREHNDANVLSIGARFVSVLEAEKAISVFLKTSFSHDERHATRIVEIEELTPFNKPE